MRKIYKSISHCPRDFLAGKNARLTPTACTLHQRSKNMPNGLIGLRKGCRHRSDCSWIWAVWSKSTLSDTGNAIKKHVWFFLSELTEIRSLCYHTVPTCLGSLVWLKLTMHSFSLEIKTNASRTACWALFGRPGWKICDQTSKYEESRFYRACWTNCYFRNCVTLCTFDAYKTYWF